MAILKTDDPISFVDGVTGGQCPVCEGAIAWAQKDAFGGQLVGKHEACGLTFALVVDRVRILVMDVHANPLVEVQGPAGIELVPKAGDLAASIPAPGPTRATLKAVGTDFLDLASEPRPTGPGSPS